MLFKIENNKINLIKEEQFNIEREIQRLVEKNLNDIFPDLHLTFIKSEFPIGGFRFDSVAFDNKENIFYVLEYKNVQNNSIVDQGFAYLRTLIDRKYDFIHLLSSEKGIDISPEKIDWESTRVIFIAPNFNRYQEALVNIKNLPFILYKFSKYSNGILSLEKVENRENTNLNFNNFCQDERSSSIQEIRTYDEEFHLGNKNQKIKDIYESFKKRIIGLNSNITIEPKKKYIAFKGSTNICDLVFIQNKIKFYINLTHGNLNDPFNIARNVENIGHWGNGDYEITVDNLDMLDNVMYLVNQSLKVNF